MSPRFRPALPTLAVLAALICPTALPAASKDAWVEVRSPHFVAYSDAGPAEARNLLRQFEEIRTVFLNVFPKIRVDAPRPTYLLVIRDEASMKRFLPKAFEGPHPKKESGVFLSTQDRNYALVRLDAAAGFDRPLQVLFHEYTHGIVHLNFPGLPTWLDEGLADFYGTTEILKDRVYLGRVSKDALRAVREGVFLPMETLLSVDHDSPHYREGDKTGQFYGQSAMLVHYLFLDPQARKDGLLGKYLAALQRNPNPLSAGREAFGDLGRLQAALVAYARQPAFQYWNYNLSLRLSDAEFAVRDLSPAQALMVRAEFLQISRQEGLARPLIEEALRLDPALPEGHAARGFAALEGGATAEALKAFETAERLGSRDFRVHLNLARLDMDAAPGDAPKRLERLEAARRGCPDHPGIQELLAQTYARDPARTGQAIEALQRALEVDPGELSHLANLGALYLHLHREEEARRVVQQLRRSARSPREQEMVAQLAKALEAHVAWRTARDAPREAPGDPTPAPVRALSFRLSGHLTPLGQEVLRLVQEQRVEEAIQRVEAALKKAQYDYDRKSLRAVLDQIRALAPAP